jgi:DNA-binding transcriptional ArsR family regulator
VGGEPGNGAEEQIRLPAKSWDWRGEFSGPKGLARHARFLKDSGMADSSQPVVPGTVSPWNEDKIYAALGDPVRRRLLLALARGGPQPGAQLMGGVRHRLSATLKHLAAMRAAGLVVMRENPRDGRKLLYALSAAVPVTKTETGAVIDFGFCLLRL